MSKARHISENIQRKLWAESMGKCMNPDCQMDLFHFEGDIAEKAHIHSYHESKDNSFENLVILCPNCHTNFDKNSAFTREMIIDWKKQRKEKIDKVFAKNFTDFKELEKVVKPILEENKSLFEEYYLKNNYKLWVLFENKILVNNNKLKLLLGQNKKLFQRHKTEEYSNLDIINKFLLHIDEFDLSRTKLEKNRQVLFPKEVNSIFGIEPINDSLFPSSESLECLIEKLQSQDFSIKLFLDLDQPNIVLEKNNKQIEILYLNDTPRLRQKYKEFNCFKKTGLRLDSLIFILKWLKNNGISYEFSDKTNFSEIKVNNKLFKLVYEYCLSKESIISLAPKKGIVILNLHNFNGEKCISLEAREQANTMGIEVLTQDEFYRYFKNK